MFKKYSRYELFMFLYNFNKISTFVWFPAMFTDEGMTIKTDYKYCYHVNTNLLVLGLAKVKFRRSY